MVERVTYVVSTVLGTDTGVCTTVLVVPGVEDTVGAKVKIGVPSIVDETGETGVVSTDTVAPDLV